MVNDKMIKYLLDIGEIRIHTDADSAGQNFARKICEKLASAGYEGRVITWNCHDTTGMKDPSDVYVACYNATDDKTMAVTEAAEKIKNAMETGTVVDLAKIGTEMAEAAQIVINGIPTQYKQPNGWKVSDAGIEWWDKKNEAFVLVCATPILISRRVVNDDGTEKIELSWTRDGQYHKERFTRSTVFTVRGIIALTDYGVMINSGNAKFIVRYLADLEATNAEVIDRVEAVTRLGWQKHGQFLPFHGPTLLLTPPQGMEDVDEALVKTGSLEGWKEQIAPHRKRSVFRFFLSAGFAAPLLRIVRNRSFGVYLWAGSRGGKTAALMATMSPWGRAEDLMTTFNSTRVYFERSATFYNDMPLAIDERQLAKSNDQASLDTLIYMLVNGRSRGRGTKDGGLQAIKTWRTVALMTGEMPLTGVTTMTGASNRVIEIYGVPFENEASATEMHRHINDNSGWAGDVYIADILRRGKEEVNKEYLEFRKDVETVTRETNGSRLDTYAITAYADSLVSQVIFGQSESEATTDALRMIAEIKAMVDADDRPDVVIRAIETIADWIEINREYFGNEYSSPCYGDIDNNNNEVKIYPLAFREVLAQKGFSPEQVTKGMVERGIIRTDSRGNSTFSSRCFNGKQKRMVVIRMAQLHKACSVGDDEECDDSGFPANSNLTEIPQNTDLGDNPFESKPFRA